MTEGTGHASLIRSVCVHLSCSALQRVCTYTQTQCARPSACILNSVRTPTVLCRLGRTAARSVLPSRGYFRKGEEEEEEEFVINIILCIITHDRFSTRCTRSRLHSTHSHERVGVFSDHSLKREHFLSRCTSSYTALLSVAFR